MKIKELMALELFQSCKLLTKDIGLDNEVDSAMVLEALDIENWSQKNQLILTSFYAFNDLPESEFVTFFEKMKKVGVSGLLIKMDRLITMIPDWLIDYCFRYEIPLIKVEQEISYEKIILTIYEPLLNHRGHLLRTYYDVRQRFTKVGRNVHSFENIMETFYQLIQLPCSLDIPSLNIHLYYDSPFEIAKILERSYVQTNEFTKNIYQRVTFNTSSGQQMTALASEIATPFDQLSTLMVYQQDEIITESQMMILENVIDIIYERLQTEYLIKKDRYTRLNNLADAILQNTPSSPDELNSLLDDAKINHHKYYQGIAFSAKNGDTQALDRNILKQLCSLRPKRIFFEHYNYTIILFNLETPAKEIQKKEIQKLFDTSFIKTNELTFSMSLVKEKKGLKEILLECLDAIRFNQVLQIDPIVSISDLGIFRYFMQEEQLDQLERLIPEQLKKLWEESPDLFDTLYTFFQSGRNYKRTAEILFLHSKTIRYRLNKIEGLLKIDLTNPLQLVNYEIGTYLLHQRSENND